MKLSRSVADVLNDHVVFEVDCIDRMYCGLHPRAAVRGWSGRVRTQATGPAGRLDRTAGQHQRPVQRGGAPLHPRQLRDSGRLRPGPAQGRCDARALGQIQRGTGCEVFIGRAQGKTTVFRTEKRRDTNGLSYPWIVKSTGLVNYYYFYCVDEDFGPFFIKFCWYFPYNAKLCLLTELREESSLLRGQVRACVATVPVYGVLARSCGFRVVGACRR
jgi:hypothetical protein